MTSNQPATVAAQAPGLVCVVIPTRNRPELLARALHGVKAQRGAAFEVIVVDDGSDASTRAAYAPIWQGLDERFRLELVGLPGQKGMGPSRARNHGIALARGDVIAFCDDDDTWTEPTHLQSVQAVFASQPAVDVYIANQVGISAQGRVDIPDWMAGLSRACSAAGNAPPAPRLVSVEQLCASGGFAHLNILSVRRQVVTAIQGFWERTGYEEDRDFFWRAVDAARQIHFNPALIARHDIPDRGKSANQTTQHSILERWLLSLLVSQHVSMVVRHPAIARQARRSEGDILRHLCQHFLNAGRLHTALDCAQRALAVRFSFKWLAYLGFLECKSLLSRGKP